MNEPNMTRRQNIIELLKQEPISFMSIANKLSTNLKEIEEDLEHISKSIKLNVSPAHWINICGISGVPGSLR